MKAATDPSMKGDARHTWRAKPGQVAHAVPVDRTRRTVCGLRVGAGWATGSDKNRVIYRAKCATCSALTRTKGRRR